MAAFELIIFDCDGVLVDSECITNSVFAQMLNEIGLPVTLEDMFEQFVGNSMARCLEIIEDCIGRPVPEGFVDEYRTRTQKALKQQLKPVTGIEEALDGLTVPFCVASSGDHDKMRTTLAITGLLHRFEGKLFSVVEVERGKPYPDLFLYAARQMGARPGQCAVVEDTEIGVRAGGAAGMTVFGYAALSNPQKLAEAGAIVFSDMQQLLTLLERHGATA